jgi:hypothetical protein
MTINLTPAIQNQIYMDKKDGYLISMVDKMTPKVDYNPEEKTTQKDEDEKKSYEKKEPFFKNSEFGFSSYMTKKSLNSSFSTQGFFDTLGSGGNVKKAS